ncbi:MAG: hypothetical protein HFF99_06815 [Oscillibacter sp.]|nr:hypothetical protein [uncultured Oscillibacter sp.]MCI8971162.1 hypothetical protein [Oscillibacter sp.]
MGELTIRRERGVTGPRYQAAERTEKTAAAGETRPAAKTPGTTVSKTLQWLMTKIGQAENHTRESHRTLQVGEAVLAEVQDSLDRMEELVRQAAGGGDRAALQAELMRLAEEIDRMTGGAFAGGTQLFLDGEAEIEDGAELPPADAVENEGQEGVQKLPGWLLKGMTRTGMTPERLLNLLGLDKSAGISEILAVLSKTTLEDNDAAGYLAALYLGSVIAGGSAGKAVDLKDALEGLRQLLEKVSQGGSPDRAVELLTNGAFTSLSDLEAQFLGGVAPGMENFLTELLLSGGDLTELLSGVTMLSLLAGMEGMELELMMGLLAAVQSSGAGSEAALETAAGENPEPAAAEGASSRDAVLDLGDVKVTGRDLSGVSGGDSGETMTIGGEADVTVRGNGQGARGLLLTGTGTVTLREVRIPLLRVEGSAVQVSSPGETVLGEVRLRPGAVLTLGGGGPVRIGLLRGGEDSVLRLTGGVVLTEAGEEGGDYGTLSVPAVIDGPVLLAARAAAVTSGAGKPMAPFDVVWRTLLPGWSAVTSLTVDGKHGRAMLLSGEPARLWLEKGERGSPIHTVIIRGRDEAQRPKTRYAYLRWNENAGAFEETVLYPNPFTVTGGEPGKDWIYEEETHTLRILTNQVTAVSGGAGTDANRKPFSGRLVLADGIGKMDLTLGGVVCRVSEGGAFDLGRENDVTLLLRSGTENRFESGAGWAGISLGDGTSLLVDCPEARENSRNPAGALSASGGAGGAGIGRDSGGGRERTSRVRIRGGLVTAVGTGGGAGIGAGKRGAMGPVDILGGVIHATGESGGGAGIGGALGAAVGDICIQGGLVTAQAVGHAAAIGAGAQGPCGDILISGLARIQKALGGDPGADIGACLFGGCGRVRIADGADIGRARLWTRSGVPLQMGAETVTLPQFRLSARVLGLDRLSVNTKEAVKAAQALVERDRRWVAQIQNAYHVLYHRLERSWNGLLGVQQYLGGGLVRDEAEAGTLLEDARRSISRPSSQALRTHGKRGKDDVRQLLW